MNRVRWFFHHHSSLHWNFRILIRPLNFPIHRISIFCPEFCYIKFMSSSSNFFVWCKTVTWQFFRVLFLDAPKIFCCGYNFCNSCFIIGSRSEFSSVNQCFSYFFRNLGNLSESWKPVLLLRTKFHRCNLPPICGFTFSR